ncbi:MAG TPA: tRNA uridine-5-carboxymethylaminomethyl(34) synthesis GTPase MnmE, partial [Clostridiales bacterium]|nr:tRNA uridine-5-carboxymethylaminomethyl(34) synthesis GTPase MnmE [Clostridiales bacterium]
MFDADTIVAISTPPGEGGIGIVRMSGEKSIDIIKEIFVLPSGKEISEIKDRYFYYGKIVDDAGEPLDEVLMVCMRGPRSYTREDIVEIHCHGGMIPIRKILELIISHGARLAEPGEFTKRAFLNGRLDLVQAEAVADLIRAKSDEAARSSLRQMEGSLSRKLKDIRERLLDLIAHIEVTIDYPEEDIDEIIGKEIAGVLDEVLSEMKRLIDSANTGKLIRQGIKTVIVGKPNVGKSSLLNALVRENRAIVTHIPGTTRDIIEEYISIRGIQVNIIDTAGIRETEDVVEKIGVERTKKSIDEADLIIAMFDASVPFEKEDEEILGRIKDKKVLVIVNKTDLPNLLDIEKIKSTIPDGDIIETSLIKGEGVEEIENYIYNMVYSGNVTVSDEPMVTNIRHENLLKSSYKHLLDAKNALEHG